MTKDINSPFFPGRPVAPEFFVGRRSEIEYLRRKVERAVQGQLEIGFVVGERGIGKSSLVSFVRHLCERGEGILGLHTFLGGISTLEEMARKIFDGLLKETIETTYFDKIKQFFGNHIREVGLFGISVEFDAPQDDLRRIVHGFVPALGNLVKQLKGEKKGFLLILDDINGLASSVEFANWIKSLVDEISTSRKPLPVCILLVGLEERRQSLINLQPSLARVFDLVSIASWTDQESRDFFRKAFSTVSITVDDDALNMFVHCAGGLPVLAHEIGDAAFNADKDGRIDGGDALAALLSAADVVGHKYLEPQVMAMIRSEKYKVILRKTAQRPFQERFTRAEILERLAQNEQQVLDNFLQRMVKLGVIEKDAERGPGAYRFINRLHYLYFWLGTRPADMQRPRRNT